MLSLVPLFPNHGLSSALDCGDAPEIVSLRQQLQSDFDNKVSELTQQHDDQITELTQSHEDKINGMAQQQTDKLAEITSQYDERMQELQNTSAAQIKE